MALLFDSLAGGSHRTMDATSKESSKDGLEDAKGTLLKKCFQFLAAFARSIAYFNYVPIDHWYYLCIWF